MPSETYANVVRERLADKARIGANNHPDAELIHSLSNMPLGRLQGEADLVSPFNTPARRPKVFVVNHSRTKTRRIKTVAVSPFHGAEEAIVRSKEYKQLYNVSLIYEMAKTRDMSLYEDIIKPTWLKITMDGRDSYIAPAPEEDPDNPPIVEVDEGCWDLYLGNYQRMHGTPQEVSAETQRLANLWRAKKNPVWRINDCGDLTERQNEFGFVEFIREMPVEAPRVRDDKPFVTALDLFEG